LSFGEIELKFRENSKSSYNFDEVTILVNSSDGYSDVIPLFESAFNEYWPENQSNIVINYESSPLLAYTEEEKAKKTWGARFLDIVNTIETDFILLLFDDFILESKIDEQRILAALEVLVNDPKGSVFFINAASLREHIDEPQEDYRILKDHADYKINSVPALWRREHLLNFTSKFDSPWSWEVFGTVRTWGSKLNFYSMSSQENNIFNYDYSRGGAIYRGKWVKPVVEDKIIKYNLDLDISDRGFVTKTERVKRPWSWKLNFLYIGFLSLRFRMFKFLLKAFLEKFESR